MSSDFPPHEQRWRAVRKARFRVAADLQSDLVEADEIEPGTVVVQISRLVEIEHKNPSGHVLHVRRCKVRVEETGILDSIFADHPEGWVTIDSRASPADGGTFFVPLGEGDEELKMLPEELADRQSALRSLLKDPAPAWEPEGVFSAEDTVAARLARCD